MTEYPEHDLYVAVIRQALLDATLSISEQLITARREKLKPTRPGRSGSGLCHSDVHQARAFIKGKTRSLEDICSALDMDFKTVRADLLKVYAAAQEHLPAEWQDREFINQKNRDVSCLGENGL